MIFIFLPMQSMLFGRTLGDVFCDNVVGMASTQADVFKVPEGQPRIPCGHPSRARIDFDAAADMILAEDAEAGKVSYLLRR